MLPRSRGQVEAVLQGVTGFGVIPVIWGLGGALCSPFHGAGSSTPAKRSFGSGSSPWSSSCVGFSEGWSPWWGRQRSLCSSTQRIPHTNKSLFMQTPLRKLSVPHQGKAHPVPVPSTSQQKVFHCFHPIIYCFVPCALEEMVLPNIFHFLSQRSLCKCLLSLLGITTMATSSNYVPNC